MEKQLSLYKSKNLNKGSLDEDELNDTNIKLIKKFDAKFLRWLIKFHGVLTDDKINIEELGDLIESLQHTYKDQEQAYANALLYPEFATNARIPRIIPVKGCSFQQTIEYRFQCNATGNFVFVFNPYFVTAEVAYDSFFLNNAVSLTGNASNNNFVATPIGYLINPIYSEACLVSQSLTVEAQVNSNTNSGTIVLGIIHDQTIGIGATGNPYAVAAKYGNFTLARTGFFNDSTNINICPAIRSIGFPIDNSFEEFLPVTGVGNPGAITTTESFKRGFAYVATGTGLQGGTSPATLILRVVSNWETLPDPAFVNVMPTSFGPNYESSEEKSRAVRVAQRRPIEPLTQQRGEMAPTDDRSFMSKIRQIGADYLPSIGALASLLGGGVGKIAGPILSGVGGLLGGNSTPSSDLKFIPWNQPKITL